MREVTDQDIKQLCVPPPGSHKGQNGKLLIIGGSHLFHAASLWALEVASRLVDLVHYSSVAENNELVLKIKAAFRDGIVVPRSEIGVYIAEDDAILIGPGMTRDQETETLTKTLLSQYPAKQWVIDAGALQMLPLDSLPEGAILTPHRKEFELLKSKIKNPTIKNLLGQAQLPDQVKLFTKEYHCTVLLKGQEDIACSGVCDPKVCTPGECRVIRGGNAGMTKGGTGDVLAGLIAALVCKNDPFLATIAGSYINKRAGDELYKTVGPFFNASDLARQIPYTMRRMLFA